MGGVVVGGAFGPTAEQLADLQKQFSELFSQASRDPESYQRARRAIQAAIEGHRTGDADGRRYRVEWVVCGSQYISRGDRVRITAIDGEVTEGVVAFKPRLLSGNVHTGTWLFLVDLDLGEYLTHGNHGGRRDITTNQPVMVAKLVATHSRPRPRQDAQIIWQAKWPEMVEVGDQVRILAVTTEGLVPIEGQIVRVKPRKLNDQHHPPNSWYYELRLPNGEGMCHISHHLPEVAVPDTAPTQPRSGQPPIVVKPQPKLGLPRRRRSQRGHPAGGTTGD